ncbi:MAG: Sua5 YciO YrdC YwlC family protein [Helicobacteraceae bacterium]|jgi:tRNA A37 threonylcarbamoyladenosine synthetase subunit TsaC/SUA5/YrdC|nr:Sua5 YciO YrdC YwlC family protein [Helicobacteraceae bacterium]
MIFLVQTDTTAGLLSQNKTALNAVKGRDADQKLIRAVGSFTTLKKFARVPCAHRNLVRRSRGRSFVFPNGESLRVVFGSHRRFFDRLEWAFSTSANRSGERFDLEWAKSVSDCFVLRADGFRENAPSGIIRLGRARRIKIR